MQEETVAMIAMALKVDPTVSRAARQKILGVCKRPDQAVRRRLGTGRQAADVLGVHRRTLQRYAREGKLTAIYQSRRRVRYDLDEVERLASEGITFTAKEA